MSLIDEQAAFLKHIRKLLDFADQQGLLVTGGELERTPEAQAAFVRSGAEASMDSPHLRKCAMTLNFFEVSDAEHYQLIQTTAKLAPVGAYWESLDPRNRWGGQGGKLVDLNRFVRDLGGWQSSRVASLNPHPVSNLALEAVATADNTRPGVVLLPKSDATMPVLKPGATDKPSVIHLQNLLVKVGFTLAIDGDFGAVTKAAVIAFQEKQGLLADGVVGEKTWTTLLSPGTAEAPTDNRFIGEADFMAAADQLKIEVATIKAVYKVESNGKGFIGDKPKILFEGHIFWRRLKELGLRPEAYVKGNEDILYPSWTKQFYQGGTGENRRLERAMLIHEDAARESASWGLFQIMGFHWKNLDYSSVGDFVTRMESHERDQLEAFCRFISKTKNRDGKSLAQLLALKDWAGFAYGYNGAGYRQNAYDDKLRENYRKFA